MDGQQLQLEAEDSQGAPALKDQHAKSSVVLRTMPGNPVSSLPLPPTVLGSHKWSDAEEDEDGNESDFDAFVPPSGQRLAPVGANADDDANLMQELKLSLEDSSSLKSMPLERSSSVLEQRLRELEEEQEELNSSLMAMTSHYAKVQLRLQQVVSAPSERREELLKELEKFAFRGIPNLTSPRLPNIKDEDEDEANCEAIMKEGGQGRRQSDMESVINNEVLEAQRKKQAELISQLKGQLEELESYAYESGEAIVPSNLLLERQRIVMEQLKARLNLNMDNIVKLSEDELKAEVDSAVGQIINPLKMKNHLVGQLKTQITDLEMFIQFLQSETSTLLPTECDGCGCSKHNSPTHESSNHKRHATRTSKFRSRTKSEQEEIRKQTVSILEKALAVLQLTAISQFGCGGKEQFYKNTLKSTTKGNHYGDLRARLELAVDHIFDACSHVECATDTDCSTTTSIDGLSEGMPEYLMSSPAITAVVRKELAPAIRDLMQHGLNQGGRRSSLVPFMNCMSNKSSSANMSEQVHAWDVIVRFYKLKQGHEYNSAPQRKLSQSFGLDLAGASSNVKQSLLATVGQIIASHGQYKRSADAHFKAFVCAGLNKRKLISWLKLILRNQTILETYYQPWSYVVKTGFDDAAKALDRLSIYVFDLPVDVAVKQFQDLGEAF